jgi:hypothetical protein
MNIALFILFASMADADRVIANATAANGVILYPSSHRHGTQQSSKAEEQAVMAHRGKLWFFFALTMVFTMSSQGPASLFSL